MFSNYRVLGVPISAVTLKSAIQAVVQWSNDSTGRLVCVRDVHGVMLARKSKELMDIHEQAAMVTPDGKPLAILGSKRGLDVSQTTGTDLFQGVIEQGLDTGVKHFFYGGNDGVAQELAKTFKAKYPNIAIAGTYTPPFRPLTDTETDEIRSTIIESKADVVWVGLSTPKQEFWMKNNVDHLPSTLIGVGAAFDFHTGRVHRAPVWVQKLTLEWFHRFLSEPKRLWRRYLVLVPQFLVLASIEQFKHRGK